MSEDHIIKEQFAGIGKIDLQFPDAYEFKAVATGQFRDGEELYDVEYSEKFRDGEDPELDKRFETTLELLKGTGLNVKVEGRKVSYKNPQTLAEFANALIGEFIASSSLGSTSIRNLLMTPTIMRFKMRKLEARIKELEANK